jgi:hypothetical protein
MISERTKATLGAAKRRGTRLVEYQPAAGRKIWPCGPEANACQFAADVRPVIEEIVRLGQRATMITTRGPLPLGCFFAAYSPPDHAVTINVFGTSGVDGGPGTAGGPGAPATAVTAPNADRSNTANAIGGAGGNGGAAVRRPSLIKTAGWLIVFVCFDAAIGWVHLSSELRSQGSDRSASSRTVGG